MDFAIVSPLFGMEPTGSRCFFVVKLSDFRDDDCFELTEDSGELEVPDNEDDELEDGAGVVVLGVEVSDELELPVVIESGDIEIDVERCCCCLLALNCRISWLLST